MIRAVSRYQPRGYPQTVLMTTSCPHDPFKKFRADGPILKSHFEGEKIAMILGHKNIRAATRDYQTFSSDAPFRVPIPSEEKLRRVRQLPIEVDPPQHSAYRKIVEPFFKLPNTPEFKESVANMIEGTIKKACETGEVEVVREFSLPIQSLALTYLLKMPESEAELWIGWGTHVFHDSNDGETRGNTLETYINEQFDRAEANPGEDFFSALGKATYEGRPLSREEKSGFANLTFAGGRDTIIHTLSFIIAYFAEHPNAYAKLREHPRSSIVAAEEFVRVVSPLTQIGRVCPVSTDVHGTIVEAGQRVGLCWASANFDENIFDEPYEVKLDRKPNPHIAYGSGPHTCLGAPHARLIIRTLLEKIRDISPKLTLIKAIESVETEADYERRSGYEKLIVKFEVP